MICCFWKILLIVFLFVSHPSAYLGGGVFFQFFIIGLGITPVNL